MAKFQSPLLGYNNNVRHNGRVFHIQTEDSGVNHPHIITHLFMDGGRILKSIKRSYAEHVGTEGMTEIVRSLMKEQHKAMFISLRDGQFDHLLEPNPSSKPKKPPESKAEAPAGPESAPKTVDESKPAAAAAPPPPAPPPPAPPPAAAPPAAAPPPAPAAAAPPPPPAPPAAPAPPPKKESKHLVLADSEVPPAPSVAELTLDFDALERDAAEAPSIFQASQLPPPPENLFKKEPGTGAYRAVDPEPSTRRESKPAAARLADSRPPASARKPPTQRPAARASVRPQPRPSQRPATEPRYAPARPAAIFGSSSKPSTPPQSVFSDDLVSDKSLDEVILSYLAEDLEPPRRK